MVGHTLAARLELVEPVAVALAQMQIPIQLELLEQQTQAVVVAVLDMAQLREETAAPAAPAS